MDELDYCFWEGNHLVETTGGGGVSMNVSMHVCACVRVKKRGERK